MFGGRQIVKKLYLLIGGFFLEFIFQPTPILKIQSLYIKTIQKFFRPFLLKTKPKKVDFSIEIKESTIIKTVNHPNKQEYYLRFYQDLSKNKVITYYYISIH
ncbi:hypothetical protein COU86_06040 [Candidatus Roizmanbacteria bacterium CG10_big_fil_rev_8_21_14_0_10_36_26]|uniref:Uncharacterized protein n=1 Tax=Candidatus Roizmanbacteria bacterium CG10_big_fil_rev_8_21_14_0_10_36_26 TaxID=1974851 RepID=A0A2M8KJQ3_9BACT|nr:MAG: hypothetical protein COU86_06040 [Candidatus Roizmanbacteria bacterium CG10_big_fil_rev_8_21_14_0_10_36_26]